MKRQHSAQVLHAVRSLGRLQKFAILLMVDTLAVPLAMWTALLLDGGNLRDAMGQSPLVFAGLFLGMALVGAGLSILTGLPRIRLNAYEQTAIQRTVGFALLVGLAAVIGAVVAGAFTAVTIPLRIVVVFTMTLAIFAVGSRIVMRDLLVIAYKRGAHRQRVLIYGAGQTGLQLAKALDTDDAVEPVAFVDDNPSLHRMMVAGLPVYSPIRIDDLIVEKQIDRVVLAMPSISRPKQARVARRLEDLGCEVSVLPSFAALVGEGTLIDRIQPAAPSDFLNRTNLECDLDGLCEIYEGASVMITGAGGSIGAELVRQILMCRAAKLILYEVSEIALYQLLRELEEMKLSATTQIVPVLGSVTDAKMVRAQIESHDVSIILHAAAYKHVNIVETNAIAGVHNNVLGTRVVAEAARDAKVGHFILVSTDKAVRPTSVMGTTKRLAEMLVLDLASRAGDTRYGIVRFGNVLGSSGSVVPLFAEQIARGGPVTLTHSDVTRYFMTLSEAARLVLLAGNYTRGGDVFVLDMGQPVPIRKLAEQMIAAAGYTVNDRAHPDGDIEIVVQGLQPGEKLHEELLHPDGELHPTAHPKISRAIEHHNLSELEMARTLRALTTAVSEADPAAVQDALQPWGGTSEPQPATTAPAHGAAEETSTIA